MGRIDIYENLKPDEYNICKTKRHWSISFYIDSDKLYYCCWGNVRFVAVKTDSIRLHMNDHLNFYVGNSSYVGMRVI